jgi:hypothetical protein
MFPPSYSCVLCGLDVEETLQHLFLQCQFAKQCWQIIGVDIPSEVDFPDVIMFLKDALHSVFYGCHYLAPLGNLDNMQCSHF